MLKYILVSVLIFSTLLIKAQDCEIPNGDFETWSGDKPVNWGTSNVANDKNEPFMEGFDMRTVFKSFESRSGLYSLHLKNVSVVEFLQKKPEWSKIPAAYKKQLEEQLKANAVSATVYSCNGDCDADLLAENTSNFEDKITFPIRKTPRSICGYYKANLKKGDKLWINPFLKTSSGGAVGAKAGESDVVITENTSGWKKFQIEFNEIGDLEAVEAGVQFYIVGPAFPNIPPLGNGMQLAMTIPGNDGSEVWIDDVCFCDEIDITNGDSNDESNTGEDETENNDEDDSDCSISNLNVEIGDCNSETNLYALTFNFNYEAFSYLYFNAYARNDEFIGTYLLSDLPITIDEFKLSGFATDYIKLCMLPNVEDPLNADLSDYLIDCCLELEWEAPDCY